MFSKSYTQRFPRRIKPRPSLRSPFRAVWAFYRLSFAIALIFSVGQNLFRTFNLIGSCWPEALFFQIWGSLLVLFGLQLSVVF